MPFCPTCETEYRDGFTHCSDCGTPLVATLPQASAPHTLSWVPAYSGPQASVQVVEMRLQAYGIPTESVPDNPDFGALSEFHTPHLAGYRVLVPAEHVERSRELVEEAVRSSTWEGGPGEHPGAEAEAAEDYDVRACPACLLYFHRSFAACPGCGAGLVPGVEIFAEGQAEPDRVIVATGPVEAVKALRDRLTDAGFGAEASEVDGWTVAAVDLPWRELTDRTSEAEGILGAGQAG